VRDTSPKIGDSPLTTKAKNYFKIKGYAMKKPLPKMEIITPLN